MTVAEAHVVSDANPFVDQRVAERGRVEQRTAVDERRIRVGRMFVRVGGERRERLDIADRSQPLRDRRGRTPHAIDRSDGHLLANEQQRGDRFEPEIERRLIENVTRRRRRATRRDGGDPSTTSAARTAARRADSNGSISSRASSSAMRPRS